MTRAELEHAVRAACDVTRLSDLIVVGTLPCDDALRARILAWVNGTVRDLRAE